jgi:hypothetical protein
MFVPCGDEAFGSLAQTAISDQNRISVVCANIVEDFILTRKLTFLATRSRQMSACAVARQGVSPLHKKAQK